MKKYLLRTIICVMSVAAPAMAWATEECDPIQSEPLLAELYSEQVNSFEVTVHGASVQVHAVNCQGQTLKVYDLVGKLKHEVHIDSNDKNIRLNLGKGVYLVNVGGVTRRIMVAG